MMTLLTLLLAVTMVTAGHYDGHQVLRVFPKLQNDVNAVAALGEELQVDFWHYPHSIGDSFHVRVSPQVFSPFMVGLRSLGLDVDVLIDDVQKIVDREMSDIRRKRSVQSGPRITNLYQYYDMDTIEDHLDALESKGDVMLSVQKLKPATWEERDIRLVKISRGDSTDKQSIFIDCGIHAREWITPAFCLYLIDRLMDNVTMVDMYDWSIIPVANPDGYAYTHLSNERLWRKNRNSNGNGNCYGVDINRNFGYHFGGAGTSSQKCSDIYRGTEAFSEHESTAIKNAMTAEKKIAAYLNVHAYSQYWMTPWGYTKSPPDDKNEVDRIAKIAVAALSAKYNTAYRVGSPGDLLYEAAGGSFDWAKGELNVTYSYALELRDQGIHGFQLPVEQIEPTVKETLDGVYAMAHALHTRKYM